MASAVPGTAVATRIATLGAWTLGTNVFDGPVRAPSAVVPVKAVFCLSGGGPEPSRTFGSPQIDRPAVQVRLRWDDKDDFDGGEAAARAIRDVVDSADLGSGYLNVRVTHTEPHYIGIGPDGYPESTINVEATYQP